MKGPLSARLVSLTALTVLTISTLPLASERNSSARDRSVLPYERERLARTLLDDPRVDLLNSHISGVRDDATASANLLRSARGLSAKRSYYGNAPGGVTNLDVRLLRALVILSSEGYSFRVTELAGGSHSRRSRHYVGVAFDIDILNGREIHSGHSTCRRFMQRCRELGATEVLGPGSRGHSTHVHVAWPRW